MRYLQLFEQWLSARTISPSALERILVFYSTNHKAGFPSRKEIGVSFIKDSTANIRGEFLYRGFGGEPAKKLLKQLQQKGYINYKTIGPIDSWTDELSIAQKMGKVFVLKCPKKDLKVLASMDLAVDTAHYVGIDEDVFMSIQNTYISEREFVTEPVDRRFELDEAIF